MNFLATQLYPQPGSGVVNNGGNAAGSTLGASFGFNVGSETFRVQLAISGLVIAVVVGLLFLHKHGYRFSVKV